MDAISVRVYSLTKTKLELVITGELTQNDLAIAFQDGLRNTAKEILVDSANSVRKLDNGNWVLTCYPFKPGRTQEIRYELRFALKYPVNTSH